MLKRKQQDTFFYSLAVND